MWKRNPSGLFLPDPSLVLDLPLDLLDGNSFPDASPYGHLCTVTGATWGSQGRVFDGDDLISIPDHTAFDITNELTMAAWINSSLFAGDNRSIISKYDNGLQTWRILCISTGAFQVDLRTSGGDTYARSAALSLNTNYFVVGTYKDGEGPRVFINAVEDNSGALVDAGGNVTAPNSAINIGRRPTANDDYFVGSIGQVWIYNRALTSAEIQRIYDATRFRYQ